MIKLLLLPLLLLTTPDAFSQEKKTIMAVFAHPDDEAVTNVSAVLARYARMGHDVYLVIATKGELGTNKHANIPAGDSLAAVRAGEALCTSEKLGIHPTILLELGDGALAKDFTAQPVREKLDSTLRLYKPGVIITWGPDGGYGHIDHRTVHNVVTELVQSGALPFSTALYYAAHPADVWQQQSSNYNTWMYKNWKPVAKRYLTTRIACSAGDRRRAIEAMRCHWSQFNADVMNETEKWMKSTGDTVYLRPFVSADKISGGL
ncbi:MAG: PIG-L deacetylase family protein [Flavisolibacter sp.]